MQKKSIWVLVLLLMIPLAAAQPYTVTVTVTGPTGAALSQATVYVIGADGKVVANGTTDARGVVSFSLAAGTYLLHIRSNFSILYPLSVTGTATVNVNASRMPKVEVGSVPLLVDFNATVGGIAVAIRTNTTIYRPSDITLSFPAEVKRWYVIPYTLYNITYNGGWTNKTTVSLPAGNYVVVAHYKLAYPVLEPWMMYAIIGVVVILILFALTAGRRGAKQAIVESRRFVQRIATERRFVKKRV